MAMGICRAFSLGSQSFMATCDSNIPHSVDNRPRPHLALGEDIVPSIFGSLDLTGTNDAINQSMFWTAPVSESCCNQL